MSEATVKVTFGGKPKGVKYRPWTTKALAEAAELYRTPTPEGKSRTPEDIARITGRSVNSVEGAFRYYGVYKSDETKARAEVQKARYARTSKACLGKALRQARELLAEGKPHEALGVIDSALYRLDGPPEQ